jgi:hypothetical protein
MLKGFDIYDCPDVKVLTAMRAHFYWCGFYLGSTPSHKGVAWMGRRQQLLNLGFRLAPLYVGQQIVGPGSRIVTAAQGSVDGHHAASLMDNAEFQPTDAVYLDLENGPPLSLPQRDYVASWCYAVERAGFRPGVYCSHAMVEAVRTVTPLIWAFRVPTVAHTEDSAPFDLAAAAVPGATLQQVRQNVTLLDWGLNVDLDLCWDETGLVGGPYRTPRKSAS